MSEAMDRNLNVFSERISTIEEVERQEVTRPPSMKDWYLSNFELFEKSLNGRVIPPIHSIRRSAISRFAELGFPTTRDEEWKYTDVTPIARTAFKPVLHYELDGVTTGDLDRIPLTDLNSYRVVCINGYFSKKLSSIHKLPAGAKIKSLSDAMREDSAVVEQHLTRYARFDQNAFTALSTAFLRDGVFIHVPDRTVLALPIHLIFLSTELDSAFMTHPRNLIVTGKNTQASIIESHVDLSGSLYFTNTISEIVVGENSVLDYYKLENQSERSYHIGTTYTLQDRNSSLTSTVMSFGGSIVRTDVVSVLNGEGAGATLNGLYLATGEQLIDNHTTIDHAKPHCESHELYKGILGGKSRGVFNGKIMVRKDAQKTNAKQTNKNLVLSDDATIDTKPQLEIFANDVKCTHGATIGQLEEDSVFYLRSRGIGFAEARNILINAFASDVIDRIKLWALREEVSELLHARLVVAHQRQEV